LIKLFSKKFKIDLFYIFDIVMLCNNDINFHINKYLDYYDVIMIRKSYKKKNNFNILNIHDCVRFINNSNEKININKNDIYKIKLNYNFNIINTNIDIKKINTIILNYTSILKPVYSNSKNMIYDNSNYWIYNNIELHYQNIYDIIIKYQILNIQSDIILFTKLLKYFDNIKLKIEIEIDNIYIYSNNIYNGYLSAYVQMLEKYIYNKEVVKVKNLYIDNKSCDNFKKFNYLTISDYYNN